MVFLRRINNAKSVTGGQVYDNQLFDAIAKVSGKTPIIGETSGKHHKNILKKLWQPVVVTINGLRLAKRENSVVFNSASCMYHLPLLLLLRMQGKKVMVIHHHYRYMLETGIKHNIYRFMEWAFLRAASYAITPNPYVLGLMEKSDPKINTLYFPLHFDKTLHTGMTPVAGNLLYIGTIERRKGLKYLIEALSILKRKGINLHLDIIGKVVEEEYAKGVKEMIERDSLDVKMHGYVSAEQKDRFLREADIFAFPSLHEGYGMVLAEAQTYSLPIICFDNSAMPYTVKDGYNGFLCNDRDANAMADAIEKVVADRELRARLSENARKSVDNLVSEADFLKAVKDNLHKIS